MSFIIYIVYKTIQCINYSKSLAYCIELLITNQDRVTRIHHKIHHFIYTVRVSKSQSHWTSIRRRLDLVRRRRPCSFSSWRGMTLSVVKGGIFNTDFRHKASTDPFVRKSVRLASNAVFASNFMHRTLRKLKA